MCITYNDSVSLFTATFNRTPEMCDDVCRQLQPSSTTAENKETNVE